MPRSKGAAEEDGIAAARGGRCCWRRWRVCYDSINRRKQDKILRIAI